MCSFATECKIYHKNIENWFNFLLGLHLEGPFINPVKRGAHKESLIKSLENLTIKDVEQFYGSLNDVSIITIAPEQAGDMNIIRKLTKRKIVVSVGK